MKKFIYIFFGIVLITGAGCLGNTREDIVDTWNLVPVDPSMHPTEMRILNNGTVVFTDFATSKVDTGYWQLIPNISFHRFRVSGVDPSKFQLHTPWNAEWYILKLDENALILAWKTENGGVFQQDFTRN